MFENIPNPMKTVNPQIYKVQQTPDIRNYDKEKKRKLKQVTISRLILQETFNEVP